MSGVQETNLAGRPTRGGPSAHEATERAEASVPPQPGSRRRARSRERGGATDGNPLRDIPGPRARRRHRIFEALGYLAAVALVAFVVERAAARGELGAKPWQPFTEPALWGFVAEGLLNNLRAAAAGMLLSLVLGVLLGLGLLAEGRAVRWPVRTVVELFRSVPLLLLLYFLSLVLPSWGLPLSDFWFLVVGLTLFNAAVIGDIVRAGILALPRGQSEGALALGFSRLTTLLLVVLPQALRAMSPALVSQLVILLKGTALAFVLGGYIELLRSATIIGNYFSASVLQAYLVASLLFMAVNLALTVAARRLEQRGRRRYGGAVLTAGESTLERPGVAPAR